MRLVDTHAHLDFPDYENDLGEVVARAKEAGVERIVTIGTDLASHERNARVVSQYPNVYQAVGLHPTDSREFTGEATIDKLRTWAKGETRVVGIGEIGLDWSRDPDEKERKRQGEQFRAQIRLAVELHLPIIIHSRDAERESLRILKEELAAKPFQGGIAHCFAGDVQTASELIELGFLISISGVVTFKNGGNVQALAQNVPLDKLVLETDSPFLSPERGKRNEPMHVRTVAEQVAQLRGVSVEEVAGQTTKNAEWLLGL